MLVTYGSAAAIGLTACNVFLPANECANSIINTRVSRVAQLVAQRIDYRLRPNAVCTIPVQSSNFVMRFTCTGKMLAYYLCTLKIKSQNAINKISDWMLANNLTLNSEKSYYMIFFSTNQDNHDLSLDLNVNNKRINRVQSSKCLGVTIDDQLKWSFHIQELCLTLRRFVGIFYKLSCKLPPLTLKMLYFAIIYPRILYGIEVYANTFQSNLHDLMVLNNRPLRILQHRKPKTNNSELYLLYNTLPINVLFKFQMLLNAHKIYYNSDNLPKIFIADKLMNSDGHSHNTRSNHDFHRLHFNTSPGSKVSVSVCTRLWNDLPTHLKQIPCLVHFSKELKELLQLGNS